MTETDTARRGATDATVSEPSKMPAQDAQEFGERESPAPARSAEVGGPKGPEPTRYGDWERKGRCIDF